jgi:hypothetical protein
MNAASLMLPTTYNRLFSAPSEGKPAALAQNVST